MTWADFKAEVLAFLEVDGKRRGLEAFRTAHTKAALSDLARFIDELQGIDVAGLEDEDVTPYDGDVAEVVAEWIKAKIARITGDFGGAREYIGSYAQLRRALYIRIKEGRIPELVVFCGKPRKFAVTVFANCAPMALLGEVWFTVKAALGDSDSCAVFQLTVGEGITKTAAESGQIQIALTADQTALLTPGLEYYFGVQVEDATGTPFAPANLQGKLIARQPVTIVHTEEQS